MQIYTELTADRPLAVALGAFDGIHIGHQAVLRQALSDSILTPAVFTFRNLIGTAKPAKRLMTERSQCDYWAKMGFDRVYFADFQALCTLSPADFVRSVLYEQLHARRVYCGFNYRFGYRGAGDGAQLMKLCRLYGIEATVTDPVADEAGQIVSSTRVREAIAVGHIEVAEKWLGHPFVLDFEIVHGRALGRTIGLPTINQPIPEPFVLPRFGVYASSVEIAGKTYHAVTNVGVKPTVGADGPLAETYISDFSGNLYGQCVPVRLMQFLRDERKFPSIEALRQQILLDSAEAERILSEK